jgi:Bacterial transcriptional activator domain/AAA ATPase domain
VNGVRFLTEGARALAARGDAPAALQWAQRLVNEAPLEEPAYRLLIQLLHQVGNTAGAVAAYQRCQAVLASALGVEPSLATRALWSQLQAAERPVPARSSEVPLSLLRPPRLVGREQAWQQMAQALAHRQALVLEGVAGVGKSRLLGDFVASGVGWTLVAASPGDSGLPFAVLARLLGACTARWGRPDDDWVRAELARLVPAAGVAASDAFATLRLQQAVGAALAHWQQQGLVGLALDDMHCADPSSIELLAPLITRTSSAKLGWLLTTRLAELAPALGELQRLVLPVLSPQASSELLATLGLADLSVERWSPVLQQRTGGNPLYMLQLLTAAYAAGALHCDPSLADLQAPVSLSALLAGRLEKLSPSARAIARLASVAGPDFTLHLACELLQTTPAAMADPWLELQLAHVMSDGHFAHDLIREASRQITPTPVRQLIHAQVADALVHRHAPAGRVAEHWDAAGCWPEAAAAFERAADFAHDRSAWLEELQALRSATRCHRATASDEATATAFATELRALELSVINTQLGDDTRLTGEDLLGRAQTAEQRAAALVVLAYYWAERYEPAQAVPLAQDALESAHRCANPRLVLLAAQRLGGALSRLGRQEESLRAFRAHASDLSSLTAIERLDWLSDFGSALNQADERKEALQILELVAAGATELKLWAVAAAALSTQGVTLAFVGRLADATRATEQALQLYRRVGVEGDGLLIDEATYAGNLRDMGHFSAYLQQAEPLPQRLRDAGSEFWAANAEHDLAVGYAWLGRADLALRTLAPRSEPLPPLMQAARLVTRSRLARDYGVGSSANAAQTQLQEAITLLAETATACPSSFNLAIELQAARDAEPAQALATVARLEHLGVQRQNLILACSAACVRLRMLLALGEKPAAAQVASDLLRRTQAHGPPAGIYAPELWWLAYQGLKLDQPERARSTLQRAVQWLHHTAGEHVPSMHRASFLTRNPVNRALLAEAQKLPP